MRGERRRPGVRPPHLATTLMKLSLAAALVGGALAMSAHADNAGVPTPDTAIELALSSNLAEDPAWLRLGRYDRALMRQSWRSEVISPGYFLAGDGRTNPQSELIATIRAVTQPLGDDPDTHAACRFPARAQWLKRKLEVAAPDPVAECPKFRAWAREGEITGVSVVFASGYFSNPGSAYGHLLMRFHSDGETGRHDLLETSINYGAADSEGDPFLPYMIKGLLGGYKSTFTDLEYFNYSQRYREAQLRDVWAYRLDLSQNDVDFLVGHAWEMLGQENRYYFLRQNCAYRIAELVSTVTGEPLVPGGKLWVTPADVFQVLAGQSTDGRPLVANVERLPSRQTTFREGYRGLSADQRRLTDAAATGGLRAALVDSDLSRREQAAALDVALDYQAFIIEADMGAAPDAAQRTELLLARMALPASTAVSPEPPTRQFGGPPHAGHRSSLVQLSGLYNDELGAGLELRVRPAYYDFLSHAPSAAKYSELSMGDVRLVLRDRGDVDLRQFEVVKVTALNISPTGAPGDGGAAWGVRLGLEDRDLACDDCLVSYAEGHFGRAAEVSGVAAFGFLSGRLQGLDVNDNYAQAGVTGGLITGGRAWKASVVGGVLHEVDDAFEARPFVRAETRLGAASRWDVRLDVEHREALESRARMSVYW